MRQEAADPEDLFDLVDRVEYKAGWVFDISDTDRGQGCEGLTLGITLTCPDAYHPDRQRSVIHYFIVPAAAYNRASWQRWLFDQIAAVELHERMECFSVDGEHVFAATHGPGDDPYVVHEYASDEQRRTSFRGDLKPHATAGVSR